jgi:hypothetical protein
MVAVIIRMNGVDEIAKIERSFSDLEDYITFLEQNNIKISYKDAVADLSRSETIFRVPADFAIH